MFLFENLRDKITSSLYVISFSSSVFSQSRGRQVYEEVLHDNMEALTVDVIAVFAALFLCCILFSLYAMYKRQQLKNNQILNLPLASELRKNRVPVIESTPFWVPSHIGHMVDVEVQPTLDNLGPKFSTPKPRRKNIEVSFIEYMTDELTFISRNILLLIVFVGISQTNCESNRKNLLRDQLRFM